MNRILAPIILVVSSAVLVACSSSASHPAPKYTAPSASTSASASGSTTSAASSAPTSQASATGAKALVLGLPDLPYGWAVSPLSANSSVSSPCPVLTPDASKQLSAQAESDFQQSEDGPFLQEIVAAGPSVQQVHTVWASIQTGAAKCATPNSFGESTALSTTQFPSYGDESYALQLKAVRAGVTYTGDVVVVRKGQTFVEVAVFGVPGITAVSAPLVQQMVGKAVGKLT